ncbi:MAG: NAD(P)H-hydrate epimerase [Acidimicrobiia bacterium]
MTADQMRDVDRRMIEDFHIELVQMMENAGRNLADLAVALFDPLDAVVLAGPGGNGGGGIVAARHLANRGVRIAITRSHADDDLSPVTAHQVEIAQRMVIAVDDEPREASLVIDALVGYGLRGDPAGRTAALIRWANERSSPVLSLDIPSGLDATTGRIGDPCVRATATLTLALPKQGLVDTVQTGTLYVADISVPRDLYGEMRIDVPALFTEGAVVRLEP